MQMNMSLPLALVLLLAGCSSHSSSGGRPAPSSCLPRGTPVKLADAMNPTHGRTLFASHGDVFWIDVGTQTSPQDGAPSSISIVRQSAAGGAPQVVASAINIDDAQLVATETRVY